MTDDSKDRWSALCRRPLPCGRRWSVVGFRSSVIGRRSSPRQQHLRPLAPGLPRRPWAAAYGLGPSVFTIRARRSGTDRASVSQAAVLRGAPPLPPMSLGTCRCCLSKQGRGCREGNGWRRPGAHPPGGEFRHRSLFLDGMVREVSEDGWGGRRQDPLAKAQVGEISR